MIVKKKSFFYGGQVLLIVILVLAVGTTVALSLIGRTTIDTSISTQVEEASRAFSAAEAGIEGALKSGQGTGGTIILTPGVNYNVDVTDIGGASGVYVLSKETPVDTTETLWLVNHNSDGSLNEVVTFAASTIVVCWSSESPTPATVVSILYKRSGSYYVAREAFDPNSSRASANKFTSVGASGTYCGLPNFYRVIITFSNYGINPGSDILLALRVRPVYSKTQFAFYHSSAIIPLQGSHIESTGTTDAGVTRKVVVDKSFPSAPTVFDASVYSQSSFGH